MSVSIRMDNYGRMLVRFPFSKVFLDKIRMIDGREWHPEIRCWSIPTSAKNLKLLSDIFSSERIYYDAKVGELIQAGNLTEPVIKLVGSLSAEGAL